MAASVTPPVPIDQRFAQLIQQFGLTKNSFAMSLGKTASVVQHLIDGRNKPGFDLLCKVFEIYPNVSRDWLLLGRGPMLVSGEPATKPTPAAPVITVRPPEEDPLEPIDTSEFDAPAPRRASHAGTRLQPEEIIATLALAAAATQPARTTSPAPSPAPISAPEGAEPDTAVLQEPAAEPAPYAESQAPASLPHQAEPAPSIPPVENAAAQVPLPAPAPLATAATPAPTSTAPAESYMAAALHAQHLQHQLALAELRNQHLQEQQNMLREMLAMARQSMV